MRLNPPVLGNFRTSFVNSRFGVRILAMIIGERLKELRTDRKMSQGDVEKRTGLLRCYISRVENGATVPSITTLEKMANALEVPMYRLFFDGKPRSVKIAKAQPEWGRSGNDAAALGQFRKVVRKLNDADLTLLVFMAQKMQQKNGMR
jgi:transcriptional regulator with XRE-family HTH domain